MVYPYRTICLKQISDKFQMFSVSRYEGDPSQALIDISIAQNVANKIGEGWRPLFHDGKV